MIRVHCVILYLPPSNHIQIWSISSVGLERGANNAKVASSTLVLTILFAFNNTYLLPALIAMFRRKTESYEIADANGNFKGDKQYLVTSSESPVVNARAHVIVNIKSLTLPSSLCKNDMSSMKESLESSPEISIRLIRAWQRAFT